MKKIFIIVLVAIACTGIHRLNAQALYPVDISEKIVHSSDIIEGRVVDQQSFWNPAHTMIYTANKIAVYKTFKGNLRTSFVEVMTTGGTVGAQSIDASDLLTLERGNVGVFFCYPNAISLLSPATGNRLLDVYASGQGCYTYDLNARTANAPFVRYASIENDLYKELIAKTGAQPFIVDPSFSISAQAKPQSPLAPVISSFSPQLVDAGATLDPANNLLTINGSGFRNNPGDSSAVLFDDSNDGSGGTPYTILSSSPLVQSWTDNEIKIRVPDRAGSGTFQVRDSFGLITTSSSPLTVNYSVITRTFTSGNNTVIKEVNLMNDDGSGGYTVVYSTSTAGSGVNLNAAPEKATFQRALNTWKEIAGYNVTEGGTTTTQSISGDGANVILFDNENTGTTRLAAGVLAVCYSYSNMCNPVLTNQIQKTEFDIVIRNEGVSSGSTQFTAGPCPPADPYDAIDLETVLLHELGHSLNLGHVNDGFEGPSAPNRNPPKLMNYSIVFGVVRKSPDYAAYSGALYCITPQGNTYGSCLASMGEMIPLTRTTSGTDECPVTFPTATTPPGTSVGFDLIHTTSNKFTDPAYNHIDCASILGTTVTNNAYYAIRSDNDGGSLNMLVSGYTLYPEGVQSSCTGSGVRLAIFQVNSCPAGQNFPNPIACRRISRNGNLQAVANLAANTNYLIYVDGVDNTKATFTLTFNGSVLPLSLLDFKGNRVNNSVNLFWKTSREINGKEFQVEKSFDGTSFSQFAVVGVKGAGLENNYTLVDSKPFSDNTFYRLKMVDKDGAFKYSTVVKVKTPKKPVLISKIFPNPTSGKLNFQVISDGSKALTIEAFDLLGKKVASYNMQVEQGMNEKPVFVNSLAAGTYFIQVKDAAGNVLEKSKFIKN